MSNDIIQEVIASYFTPDLLDVDVDDKIRYIQEDLKKNHNINIDNNCIQTRIKDFVNSY